MTQQQLPNTIQSDLAFIQAERIIQQCGNGSSGLFLHRLRLTRLPPAIGALIELRELFIADQRLTEIPPEIGKLKKLEKLALSHNQLSSLPPEIGNLSALRELYLIGNNLTGLPPEFENLTKLEELYLWGNPLGRVPRSIGKLKQLRVLNIAQNRLSELPRALRGLVHLKELYLHGNPGLRLPEEVLGPTSALVFHRKLEPKAPSKILDFYFRERTSQLLESRILVIGDGGVGKTSLVRRLLHGIVAQDNEPSTRDIAFERWEIPCKQALVKISVWDFGGQTALHAAHPLFFTTERTLYILVVSARDNNSEERIDYWLKMVAVHGKGARAIVVVNRVDEHPMDIGRLEICAKHSSCLPENVREAFYPTSCITGFGIPELNLAIKREIAAMEQVWTLIPNDWFAVKEAVDCRQSCSGAPTDVAEKVRPDTMTLEQWQQVCTEHGVSEPSDQDELMDLLRNLGLLVCFPNDPRLSNLGVLNPEWVTRAIYPVLTSEKIAAAGGLIEIGDLLHLLPVDRYPSHRHYWLFELLRKSEIIFGFDDGKYIAPSRLPRDTPDWAQDSCWSGGDVLRFEMRYSVLPENVIGRFIVRNHSRARLKGSWWRHGMALKDTKCEALVRANLARAKVDLFVRGPAIYRREFASMVREALRAANFDEEGELWVVLEGGYAEKFIDLLVLANAGERLIKRVVGGVAKTFDLTNILDLIANPIDQQKALQVVLQMGSTNINASNSQVTNASTLTDVAQTNLNALNSTLGNIRTLLSGAPSAATPDAGETRILQALRELSEKLATVDSSKVDEATVISQRLEELVKNVTKPAAERKKSILGVSANGLKAAAEAVGDIVPGLIETAGTIAAAIASWTT